MHCTHEESLHINGCGCCKWILRESYDPRDENDEPIAVLISRQDVYHCECEEFKPLR